MTEPRHLSADEPITEPGQDRLNRSTLARLLAAEIRDAPSSDGFVISIMGPWGCGKTSVLNLVEGELGNDIVVLRFNPWLFTGAEQLISRFFAELGAQLRSKADPRLGGIAAGFVTYGNAVAPLLPFILGRSGSALTALFRSAGKLQETQRPSVESQRKELEQVLRTAQRPIAVFIDDLDRLDAREVLEVMRLVKLVADLPGVRYVLCFDRERVERILEDKAGDGRAYLEKIVQAPHDVPEISPTLLRRLCLEALEEALSGHDLPHFSIDAWRNLFRSGVAPMLTTMREARRYANAAPFAIDLTGTEVAAHDVLALTAIRVFDPDVHARLPEIADVLTGWSGSDGRFDRGDEENGARLEAVLETSTHGTAIRALLRLLFPAAGNLLGGSRRSGDRRWRAERRVASHDAFDAYLRATLGEDAVSTTELHEVLAAFDDPLRLRELLARIPSAKLSDLCDRILDYQDELKSLAASEAALVFAEQEDRVAARETPLGFPFAWAVISVMELLLGTLPEAERSPAVEWIVDHAPNLSIRLRTIGRFGTFPEREERRAERELLDGVATARLEEVLAGLVSAAPPEILCSEPELPRLLACLFGEDEERGRREIATKASDDLLFRTLLRQSFGWGSRTNETGFWPMPQLNWENLTHLLGAEFLVERVRALAPQVAERYQDDDERKAWELASDYVTGKPVPRF